MRIFAKPKSSAQWISQHANPMNHLAMPKNSCARMFQIFRSMSVQSPVSASTVYAEIGTPYWSLTSKGSSKPSEPSLGDWPRSWTGLPSGGAGVKPGEGVAVGLGADPPADGDGVGLGVGLLVGVEPGADGAGPGVGLGTV